MATRIDSKLETHRYYEVIRRRLFGPRENISDGSTVIELKPGDLVKCETLYILNGQGNGNFASFSVDSAVPEAWVIEKISLNKSVPSWLRAASPLRALASASE